MPGAAPQQRFGCYIGNIDRSVSLELLKELFSQCGTIVDCSLNGRDEDPYRYGFIDFATEEDRSRAMKFNSFLLHDRRLKVGISKGNVNKPEAGTGNRRHQPNDGSANNNNNNYSKVENNMSLNTPGMGGNPANGISKAQMDMLVQALQYTQQQGQNPTAPVSASVSANMLPPATPGTSVGNPVPPPFSALAPTPSPVGAPMNFHNNVPLSGNTPPPLGMGGPGAGVWGGPGVMMPGNGPNGGYMPGGAMPPLMGNPGGLMPPVPPPLPHHGLHSRGMGSYSRGPANPPPSPEVLQLRERQRTEFLEVVRKDAEKYEKKMEKKHKKKENEKEGTRSSEDEGEDSENEPGDRRKRKTETSDEVHEKESD